jgi:DNA-binding NarL/FixJ family response regulator
MNDNFSCVFLEYQDAIITPVKLVKPKPVMIYFRSPNDDVTKGDSAVVADYNKVLPVDVVVCDGWLELSRLLLGKPNQISINSNVFTSTDATTIKETIGMLQTTLKLAKLNIPIALVIENNTHKHVVLEAKKLGLQGLIPHYGDWDPADIMDGLAALTDRKYHWPEHIINQLPNKKSLPNVIYFNDDHSNTPNCTRELLEKLSYTWTCPSDWEDLAGELKKGHQHLMFHVEMIDRMSMTIDEFLDTLKNINRFTSNVRLYINAIIRKTTNYQVVKKLKKVGIDGIALDFRDWTLEEVNEGAAAFLQGKDWWPQHIIGRLPGANANPAKVKPQGIVLTDRQQEVFNLVCRRGLSNKKIAQTLKISESTVKIHVSAILKSYGVRSRTQLVVASSRS